MSNWVKFDMSNVIHPCNEVLGNLWGVKRKPMGSACSAMLHVGTQFCLHFLTKIIQFDDSELVAPFLQQL